MLVKTETLEAGESCSHPNGTEGCCVRRSKRRRMLPSGTSSNAGWLVLLLPMMLVLLFLAPDRHGLNYDQGRSVLEETAWTDHDISFESFPGRELSKHHHKVKRQEPIDYPEYSCDALSRLQAKYPNRFDQCEFAKTCNDGEGIIFPSLFCDDGSSNQRSRQSLLLVFLTFVLLLLFRLLGSTTDEFFAPGLEMFSLQLGLPPRFAGVTLLALGNGAPDVAATMNAILGDEKRGYEMALGELTGTCMFVTSLILGAIIALSSTGSGDKGGEGDENGKRPAATNRFEDEVNGVPCRGPLMRDIAVLILVCAVSMSSLKVGVVDYGFVYTLLGLYGAYVLLVLFADAYHVFYHAPSLVKRESSSFISLNEMDDTFPTGDEERPPFVADEQTPLVAPKTSHYRPRSESAPPIQQCKRHPAQNLQHLKSLPIHSHSIRDTVIEAMSNYSCHEEEQLKPSGSHESNASQDEKEIKRSSSDGMPSSLTDNAPKGKEHSSGGWGPVQSDGTEPIVTFHPHHAVHPHHGTGGLLFLRSRSAGGGSSPASGRRHLSWRDEEKDEGKEKKKGLRKSSSADATSSTTSLTAAAAPKPEHMQVTAASSHATEAGGEAAEESGISRPGSWGEALTINAEEFWDHWRDFFADIYRNNENSILDVIFLSVELPFTIIRKLTNPVPCDGYYCRPMVAVSVALSPVWLWFYFADQFDTDIYSSYAGYVASATIFLAALFVLRYAPGGEGPMDIYMVIPLTLYGFAIAATWLDSIADKLVELLDLFGILLRIPSTVMGLTVLAFGNSLQDLVANVSLSKKGLSSMATTACFAGPIFNLCVGLGFGFWALMKSTGKDHIRVELPRNIATGFWFTIANCALIVFSGVVIGKGVIGRGYGYVACGLYVVYVVTSLYI